MGSDYRRAQELRDHWVAQEIAEVLPGPHGAQIIRLKSRPRLLAPTHRGEEAKTGNPSSPCVPYRHTQGEEDEGSRRASSGEVQGEDDVSPHDSIKGLGAAPASPTEAPGLETRAVFDD